MLVDEAGKVHSTANSGQILDVRPLSSKPMYAPTSFAQDTNSDSS